MNKTNRRYITAEKGMWSDGATCFIDLGTNGLIPTILAWIRNRMHHMLGNVKSGWFFVHDKACNTGLWDSGEEMSNWQASTVAGDILYNDGWRFLSVAVWWVTFGLGGGEARKNGMFMWRGGDGGKKG